MKHKFSLWLKLFCNVKIETKLGDYYEKIGFGRRNVTEILNLEKLDYEGKKAHAKNRGKDPENIMNEMSCVSNVINYQISFGTRDNPIPIDESKL